MRDIKFEYLVVFESGEVKKTILTLEEIEKNSEFSSFGQAIANVANGVKEIYRRQYTGLKDKNGVEIYEGDLLEFEAREWYGLNFKEGQKGYVFKVEQCKTGEWVGAGVCTEWETYCEVIGNIYENPKLLEN